MDHGNAWEEGQISDRGRRQKSESKVTSVKLEDKSAVLGDMKGTPRDWRKVRNEAFAILTTEIV